MNTNIGCNCVVDSRWVPKDVMTGVLDIEGKEIKTSDTVRVRGCSSSRAIVGRDHRDKFMLFFGSDIGSIGWNLDEETVKKHKIKVLSEEV